MLLLLAASTGPNIAAVVGTSMVIVTLSALLVAGIFLILVLM
jgi:hypothetical protein